MISLQEDEPQDDHPQPKRTMRGWKHRIDTSPYFKEGMATQEEAHGYISAIKAHVDVFEQYSDHFDIEDILENLEYHALREDWDEYNAWLDDLYDWCDDLRIWFGPCTLAAS
jgi:hypothetical protein